jgi:hypothetical protein
MAFLIFKRLIHFLARRENQKILEDLGACIVYPPYPNFYWYPYHGIYKDVNLKRIKTVRQDHLLTNG